MNKQLFLKFLQIEKNLNLLLLKHSSNLNIFLLNFTALYKNTLNFKKILNTTFKELK